MMRCKGCECVATSDDSILVDQERWCHRCAPQEIKRLRQDEDDLRALTEKLSKLLTGVVNVVRGDPPPLTSWGWHDAPELVRGVVQEVERLRSDVALLRGYSDPPWKYDPGTISTQERLEKAAEARGDDE